MSELKFFCPRCNQKIQCDEQWSGQQIQCPGCQVEMTVPQPQGASAIAPPPPPLPIQHAPPPAPIRPSPVSAGRSAYRPPAKKTGSGGVKVVKYAVGGIAAIVGFYFGFKLVNNWQGKLNEETRRAEQNSDGGQVGHIADLYSVLDATDPNRGEMSPNRREAADRYEKASREAAATSPPEKEQPVIPAVWTLEPDSAKIPEGRVNGTISGTNFVMDMARLERSGQSYVLTLRQGLSASADREIQIYLRLGAGEHPLGYTQTISPDMKGARVPQIVKRWKPNPKYAAQQKSYNTGYVLKLELGKLEQDSIPGKVYVALPDTEQTVVAGVFKIKTMPARMGFDEDNF